jgi:hypothetical protein
VVAGAAGFPEHVGLLRVKCATARPDISPTFAGPSPCSRNHSRRKSIRGVCSKFCTSYQSLG